MNRTQSETHQVLYMMQQRWHHMIGNTPLIEHHTLNEIVCSALNRASQEDKVAALELLVENWHYMLPNGEIAVLSELAYGLIKENRCERSSQNTASI